MKGVSLVRFQVPRHTVRTFSISPQDTFYLLALALVLRLGPVMPSHG